MAYRYVLLTAPDYDAIDNAEVMSDLAPVQARTNDNNFRVEPVYRGSSKKPHPFTYMKTIGGQTTLINFSHELSGKLIKKCRNLIEAPKA